MSIDQTLKELGERIGKRFYPFLPQGGWILPSASSLPSERLFGLLKEPRTASFLSLFSLKSLPFFSWPEEAEVESGRATRSILGHSPLCLD